MAIKASQITHDGNLEVIARIDSALNVSDEQYGEYIKTLDESLLTFNEGEEPTRFVMRKSLPYALSQKIKNKQLKIEDGEIQFQMGSMAEEVRAALIAIKNPDGISEADKITFTKASDGGASEQLISSLDAVGIVTNLYTARRMYFENVGKFQKKS